MQRKDHVRTQEDGHLKAKEGGQESPNLLNTLILDFQPPELRENKFLLVKLCSLWYFVTAVQAGTMNMSRQGRPAIFGIWSAPVSDIHLLIHSRNNSISEDALLVKGLLLRDTFRLQRE